MVLYIFPFLSVKIAASPGSIVGFDSVEPENGRNLIPLIFTPKYPATVDAVPWISLFPSIASTYPSVPD